MKARLNPGDMLASPVFTQDPYPTYRALRESDPVHWSEHWGVWVLTRYADIIAVLKDSATYSNAGRFAALVETLPPEAGEATATISQHNASGMLQSDPPDHTRLRGLIRLAFTPRMVEALRPRVEMLVDDYLDAVDPSGFDLIQDLSFRLPITVILDLMGLPVSDAGRIAELATAVASLQSTGKASAENATRAAAAITEIEDYFAGVCDERRRAPGDDLISKMLAARDQEDRLTQDELINMCVNILFAGHQTTEHLIGNAARLFLDHPVERRRVNADPTLWTSAVEECLRFESPIQRGWRRVATDTELAGRSLRKDDLVYLMLGAANRDPSVFADPDTFDVGREPNRHLAFGYGIHFCIGAPLARIEAPIALRKLFAKFPEVRIKEPPSYHKSVHLRGLERFILEA